MKILVIQSKMGIGDTIIYLPYIEAISRQYNSKVTLLAKKNSKASELRESCEYIENIISCFLIYIVKIINFVIIKPITFISNYFKCIE